VKNKTTPWYYATIFENVTKKQNEHYKNASSMKRSDHN